MFTLDPDQVDITWYYFVTTTWQILTDHLILCKPVLLSCYWCRSVYHMQTLRININVGKMVGFLCLLISVESEVRNL